MKLENSLICILIKHGNEKNCTGNNIPAISIVLLQHFKKFP